MQNHTLGILVLGLLFVQVDAFAFAKKKPPPPPPPVDFGPVYEHGRQILKVLTYNIHGLSLPWTDTDLIEEIGRQLAKRRRAGNAPHIVAIQEGFHAAVEDLMNLSEYPYRRSGPGPDWPRTGSGLVMMSEYPVVGKGTHAFALENSAGMDWNARKGVQYIKVRLPGLATPIQIFNTHLQADYDTVFTPLDETIAARRRQHLEIREWFWKVSTPENPILFAGDFNTNISLPDYYDIVAATFLTNAAETCAVPAACTGGANPWGELNTGLDHQFFRPEAGGVRLRPVHYEKVFTQPVNGEMLSDHEGLEVHYEVTW